MILTLVLLAQVVTPVPTPRPVHAPATLGGSPPPMTNSLAGAAKGRKINVNALSGPVPTGVYSKPVKDKAAVEALTDLEKQETYWRERAASIRTKITDLEAEKTGIENEIGAMFYRNRDGTTAVDDTAREAAVAPIVVKLKAAQAELARLPEDCRKAGCQPGWIR